MSNILLALGLSLFAISPVLADKPVEVMILATYHFDNPGQDIHNSDVDDVLLPKRQQEIAKVVDALASFGPTKVAVEVEADKVAGHQLPSYQTFIANKAKPSRDEITQLGFRLAKQAGHTQVYGIDIGGEFPYEAGRIQV